MEGSSENGNVVKPVNLRGMGNRRALQDIENLVGVHHPVVAAKRQLNDKNPVVARRPITRKYAAALERKSQSCDQEASSKEMDKNSEPSMEKVHLTDVDSPMVEESEQMDWEAIKEVVMEELTVNTVRDIDHLDLGNPLAVVEYVDDIYKYYKRVESRACVDPNYMSTQHDINEQMRAILVDWLIEVHFKFELMEETLYLTVNLLDRFLSKQTVVRKKLQLVGATAMLLACKYEEISAPVINELVEISDRAFTKEEVLSMEKLMANTLQFNFSVPTPCVFMNRFLKAAEADERVCNFSEKMKQLSHYLIELCLVEYEMLKFKPSLLAAAVVFTAKCCLQGFTNWTMTCISYTTYTHDQLMECSRMVVKVHQKAGQDKLKSVHSKYSTFQYGYVARFEPAFFLLEDDI